MAFPLIPGRIFQDGKEPNAVEAGGLPVPYFSSIAARVLS